MPWRREMTKLPGKRPPDESLCRERFENPFLSPYVRDQFDGIGTKAGATRTF